MSQARPQSRSGRVPTRHPGPAWPPRVSLAVRPRVAALSHSRVRHRPVLEGPASSRRLRRLRRLRRRRAAQHEQPDGLGLVDVDLDAIMPRQHQGRKHKTSETEKKLTTNVQKYQIRNIQRKRVVQDEEEMQVQSTIWSIRCRDSSGDKPNTIYDDIKTLSSKEVL